MRPVARQCTAFSLVFLLAGVLILALSLTRVRAEDWPEWRGKGRTGVWNETGALEKFPENGLEIRWRRSIRSGYSGPSVAGGRVYAADFEETAPQKGTERILCLDEATGKVLWSHSWPVSYARLARAYAIGPRATPTVDARLVYVVGATGILHALHRETGELMWGKNFENDYATEVPTWGVTGAPLVEGDLLIAIVGGAPDAEVVAFNKHTGEEVWRALSPEPEMGYAQPIIFEAGGVRQLIVWHPSAVSSLNPQTGEVYWEEPWEVRIGMTVATPVRSGDHLFLSQFYGGSMMMRMNPSRPSAGVVWKRKGRSELPEHTDSLHALITTPVVEDGLIFGVCSYGQFRCLDASTGDRIWESLELIELGRWAAAFLVRNGDRYFANNDLGDLIIARFDREGYHEIDRTHLIEPTTDSSFRVRPGGRRRPSDRVVNWVHPAYANGHIVARNDKEILSASLKK